MFRSVPCGALAALVCFSSLAVAQDATPTYSADFNNKTYMSLNGVRRSDIYKNEPMAVRVDVKVRQTDSGPKKPGKFKVGISNFNPRGGEAYAETAADAPDPTTLVAFIPIGSGTSNQYDGEVFKYADAIDPAGARVDGVSPRWMIGGLNEDLREGDRAHRQDKNAGTPPKDIPEGEVAARMFDPPADAEEARKAEENRKLIDAALQKLLEGGDDRAKAIAAARAGNDEDLAKFFANPPQGLDLKAFDGMDAAQRRRALTMVAIQVVGKGPTDAAVMETLAKTVKQAGTPRATTATAAGTPSQTTGVNGALQQQGR